MTSDALRAGPLDEDEQQRPRLDIRDLMTAAAFVDGAVVAHAVQTYRIV